MYQNRNSQVRNNLQKIFDFIVRQTGKTQIQTSTLTKQIIETHYWVKSFLKKHSYFPGLMHLQSPFSRSIFVTFSPNT